MGTAGHLFGFQQENSIKIKFDDDIIPIIR